MDRKKHQLFTYYYRKLKERNFDEKDLYSFLVLVGEESDHEVIQAMSHFVIYREKSTGMIAEYLNECKEIISSLEQTAEPKKIELLFTFKDLRNGLNDLFSKVGVERLPNDVLNDFLLCYISLLQDVKLLSENGQREVGHLSFAASSKELFLMGNMRTLSQGRYIPVTFPVMSVQNRYEKVTPQDEQDTPYLFNDTMMEVIRLDGELVITFPSLEEQSVEK